jgi:integrating conjugative element membrane protein (TIGR03747 family)
VASRNASFREDVFVAALLRPLRLMLWAGGIAVGLLIGACLVDAYFVFHVWAEGIEHLRQLLVHDVERLSVLAARQGWPEGFVTRSANVLYRLVFEASGMHEMGVRFSQGQGLSILDSVVRGFYLRHAEGIEVAMVAVQLFGARLALLAMASPLLLLMYAVGAVQGIVYRRIRTACGGRESASLYHRAKHGLVVTLAVATLLVLMLPVTVDPRTGLVVFAGLVALGATVQWRFYKKAL